jgi:hypothetical protein
MNLNEVKAGYAYYVRLGGTPSKRLLLAGEYSGWTRTEAGLTFDNISATFTALFYPAQKAGLFLKGGVGVADESVTSGGFDLGCAFAPFSTCSSSSIRDDFGFALIGGLGYDIRIRDRNFDLTPNADLLFQKINGGVTTLFLLSLGVTWH